MLDSNVVQTSNPLSPTVKIHYKISNLAFYRRVKLREKKKDKRLIFINT